MGMSRQAGLRERRCEETSKKYRDSQNPNAAALHHYRSSARITAELTHKQTRMEDIQKRPIIWQDFAESLYGETFRVAFLQDATNTAIDISLYLQNDILSSSSRWREAQK